MHFLRNVLAAVPKGSAETAAAIRTIFAQPTRPEGRPVFGMCERVLERMALAPAGMVGRH